MQKSQRTIPLRTIPGIIENLKPLDDAINNSFIPALFGQEINENIRDILSLPIKEGGLGIRKVSNNSEVSYTTSCKLTLPLTNQIFSQSDSLPDADKVQEAKSKATHFLKVFQTQKADEITQTQAGDMKRTLEQLSAPGASSWLGAMPIQSQGMNLTKGEFQDGLALRYKLPVKNLPSECPCGKPFNVTHALNCHLGGFINVRHDTIKDFEFGLLRAVVNDV